jgi:Carboxypeptidase regulatory-like domain
MRRLHSIFLLCLSLIVTLTCAPAPAQTVDTAIIGTITDSSGAAIPGATVVVSSSATGIKKQAVTGSGGEYTINYLTPGNFDVTVSANGFRSAEQTNIVLQINQQARVNLVMGVAGQEQTIQVQGTQPLLQTEDASLGVVVGADSAANLPLNGRKFNDLAILTPGVTVYNPDNHSSSTDGSAISAYGSQVTWAQVNVDGVTMVNNRHAYINVYPSVDAIQEFKVLTGNAESE